MFPNPTTGDPYYALSLQVHVKDDDGVPDNIQSVVVTFPDGTTKKKLTFWDSGTYGLAVPYSNPADIPSGTYIFTVTDFDGNTAQITDDVLVDPISPVESLEPAQDSYLTLTTPLISWVMHPQAKSYRVRMYSGYGQTYYYSDSLMDNHYIPAYSKLSPYTNYGFRIYASREDWSGGDADNLSSDTVYSGNRRHFTTGADMGEPTPPGAETSTNQVTGGVTAADYRMIAFSVNPGSTSLKSALEAVLGVYDTTQWRLFAWDTEQVKYVELNSSEWNNDLDYYGRGYFIILRDTSTLQFNGEAYHGYVFGMMLRPGWNLIGNPFNEDIPLSQIKVSANGLSGGSPLGSSGLTSGALKEWVNNSYQAAAICVNGHGYWIKNLTSSDIYLIFDRGGQQARLTDQGYGFDSYFTSLTLPKGVASADDDQPPFPPGINKPVAQSSSNINTSAQGGGCDTIQSREGSPSGGEWVITFLFLFSLIFWIAKRRSGIAGYLKDFATEKWPKMT